MLAVTAATSLLLPALLAALVAIGATLAVERFGGVVGGLLGTMPTTIVPAALGIWLASPEAFGAAMAVVPCGMAVNALFLWTWRWAPPLLPRWSLHRRLLAMVALSLLAWAGVGALVVAGLAVLPGTATGWAGVAATAGMVSGGLVATRHRAAAPRGTRHVPAFVVLARGVLAAVAIAVAVGVSQHGNGLVAGLASVFPAIFLTTMVSLWLSQDEAVPAGAVGPMMLGSGSVAGFALGARLLVPPLGIGLGITTAWLLAVGVFTLPAWWWLTLRGAPR